MPDTSTEVAIATTTLGSAASTITFSSIPGTYTDLRLVANIATVNQGDSYKIRFNSDSGTNYSHTEIIGNGSTADSYRTSNANGIWVNYAGIGTPAGAFPLTTQFISFDLFSYAGSTNKTGLLTISNDYQNTGAGNGTVTREVGLWRNTSAVTSITLVANSSNFYQGCTATLYGIL